MNVDEALRQWGAREREATTATHTPVDRFRSSRRPALLTVAAAVVVVVAVATGVVLVRGTGPDPTRGPTPLASEAPVASPGSQLITYHGVTVQVPDSWPLNADRCGRATADTVIIGGGAEAACGSVGPVTHTSVRFDFLYPGDDAGHGTPTRIGDHSATRFDTTQDGAHTVRIDIPDVRTTVTIISPSADEAEQLVGALSVTAADTNGCLAQIDAPTLVDQPRSGSLVPADPSSVVLCRYRFGYLEQGATLDGTQATHLAQVLNGLPTGLSRANPADYAPELCWNRSDPPNSETENDSESYLIHVQSAGAADLVLTARITLCGLLGVSGSTGTAQAVDPLMQTLATDVGNAAGWQGDIRPAD